MRARYLLGLLSLSLLAQQKDIRFEQVGGGSLSGYTEDEKAEKAWEMNAKVMKPSEDSGKWDMQELSGQTFQSGKPSISFSSPNGVVDPTKRIAEGKELFKAFSSTFNLAGIGWTWKGTSTGDTFSILEDVVAELDLTKPKEKRFSVKAPRLDVTPTSEGTQLTFSGGVTFTRQGEQIICEAIDCILDDSGVGDKNCKIIKARGQVVRTFLDQTIKGDSVVYFPKTDQLNVAGNVKLTEPTLNITSDTLAHDGRTGITLLQATTVPTVAVKAQGKDKSMMELTGRAGRIERDLKSGLQTVVMDGQANFISEQGMLNSQKISVKELTEGGNVLIADGSVRGLVQETSFNAEHARWVQVKGQLELSGKPNLVDKRGIDLMGAQIFSDSLVQKVIVKSDSTTRATIKFRSESVGAEGAKAEANQIVISNSGTSAEADLTGAVKYSMDKMTTESDRLVAYSVPRTVQTKSGVFDLQKLILTGKVRFAQPGLSATSERADFRPSIEVQEILVDDSLKGKVELLTLGGGSGATRPKLFLEMENEKVSEFTADAHEILSTKELTKMFLRGSVAMQSPNINATCDLLEGLARPDKAGNRSPELIVGRGNVTVKADGTTAVGRTMEINPNTGEARLFGDARVRDRDGHEGVPANSIVYDYPKRIWRMDQVVNPQNPKQVIRPKIILGPEFFLPQVKTLDKAQ